jgi:hypothetical protein
VPQHVKELVFVVKRFYKPEWGADWRRHFSVDIINGEPANELKCDNRKLVTNYLRVGFDQDGAWRTFGLRKDFQPAVKLAMEDDITASVVVPASALANLNPDYQQPSVKFVRNCEYRLFQRPDDAVHRGYDKQTEFDFTQPGNFLSNYEPLDADARARTHRGLDRLRQIHRADAGLHPRGRTRQSRALTSCPPPIRVSSRAVRRRTRATCRRDPISCSRATLISRKSPHVCGGAFRWSNRSFRRSTPCSLAAATIRPSQAFARSLSSIRSITSNCRNCFSSSFAA